jgi:hypothetical protein
MGEQSYWAQLLSWIRNYQVGDLASIAGVAISLVGFAITVIAVRKSRSAAQAAAQAARDTASKIRLLESVVDFSAAIAILEEIKRLQREKLWMHLPDRYATIRKLLITLRGTNSNLNDGQESVVQRAVTNLRDMEEAVERFLGGGAAVKAPKFNSIISQDVDDLLAVLIELKAAQGGTRS